MNGHAREYASQSKESDARAVEKAHRDEVEIWKIVDAPLHGDADKIAAATEAFLEKAVALETAVEEDALDRIVWTEI